jgi:hypothetical protein
VKETIWRDIAFKEGTTEKQIIDFIEENGVDNIYDASFYEDNELLEETSDSIYPQFEQDGYETVAIVDEEYNELYSNRVN